ncbi:MAG: hypothetical protein KAR33_09165 [Candidatus Thorarchaeota archaeon]|nr:hypothetical protein [Candidatus Thorarchaeota archaeon]
MLRSISFKIYEMRKYLLLTLALSMIAIPVADALVIQRDRNRNEMYGEAFWIFGFSVYEMTDSEVAEAMGDPYDDGQHILPPYLGNITYEYPVFGLIFFAIASWLYPGVGGLQHLWLNFILVLVFMLNLVLIAILLKDKLYNVKWARLFFAGYFAYGLIMSAGGGKLEPITDCLLLMALVLHKEGQNGKAMFTLGLSIQTKIYSVVALPILFLASPVSIIWLLLSTLLTVLPFMVGGARFDSLIQHFLNTSDYSTYVVNPMYPGLAFDTTNLLASEPASYIWLPALIPLVIYIGFMLFTFERYLPKKDEFMSASWWERILLLRPLYLYMVPAALFIFRWVMPWYLFWFGGLIFLFKKNEHAIGYLKEITIIGFVYALGVLANWPYFLYGPLPDFLGNFPLGVWSLVPLIVMIVASVVVFAIWRWTFNRQEARSVKIRKIEERGELVI